MQEPPKLTTAKTYGSTSNAAVVSSRTCCWSIAHVWHEQCIFILFARHCPTKSVVSSTHISRSPVSVNARLLSLWHSVKRTTFIITDSSATEYSVLQRVFTPCRSGSVVVLDDMEVLGCVKWSKTPQCMTGQGLACTRLPIIDCGKIKRLRLSWLRASFVLGRDAEDPISIYFNETESTVKYQVSRT
jgi:hypothetical protein